MSSFIEEMRVPAKRWMVWSPVVTLLRHFVVAALLVGLAGTGYPQVGCLMLVQVSYFAWTTTAGIKFSKYDNIKEIIDQILELAYLTLKVSSLATSDVYTQQEKIGRGMLIVLFLYFANNLAYVIFLLIHGTIGLYTYFRHPKRNQIEVKSSPTSQAKDQISNRGQLMSDREANYDPLKEQGVQNSKTNLRKEPKNGAIVARPVKRHNSEIGAAILSMSTPTTDKAINKFRKIGPRRISIFTKK